MSNSFERFRRTNQQRLEANKKLNSQFIIKGYPSIEITNAEYGRWVAKNKKLYNHVWKLQKYNSSEYSKYYIK